MRLPSSRMVGALAGALAFGLLAGWLHGNDGGLRAALGNVSTPWLLVALVPAWWAGSARRGAVLGTATTMLALVGFYVSLTATMLGHLGTTHGLGASLDLVLASNRIWFVAGLFSGPLCGASAGFLGARVRPAWLGVLIGALMAGEVVAVAAVQRVTLPLVHVGWATSDARVSVTEAVAGLVILGAAAVRGFPARSERA